MSGKETRPLGLLLGWVKLSLGAGRFRKKAMPNKKMSSSGTKTSNVQRPKEVCCFFIPPNFSEISRTNRPKSRVVSGTFDNQLSNISKACARKRKGEKRESEKKNQFYKLIVFRTLFSSSFFLMVLCRILGLFFLLFE